MEGVGEGVARGDEDAPTAAGGVERNFDGNLIFTHEAVLVENLDGEIDLGFGGGAGEARGDGEGPKDGARVAGVGGGDVDEDAFVAVGEGLADSGEVGQMATLPAMVGALEFAGLLVGGGEGGEGGVHLKAAVIEGADIHGRETNIGGLA